MTEMPFIYILADDLTGSADAANYFRTAKRKVRVSFLAETPWDFSLDATVVQVFDAESRGLDLPAAKQRILQAAEQLARSGDTCRSVYKKVDSTLRGHIGGEIAALLQGLGRQIALLAPAFPMNGRTVQDGKLFVNAVAISQTPFAKDPHNPVTSDKVADIVQKTTDLPVVELSAAVIAQGPDAVRQFLSQLPHSEAIVVADSTTDDDLAVLARAVAGDPNIIPCGSAGLARQLAALWCRGETPGQAGQHQQPVCAKVLVAVGSANPLSHEQLVHLTTSISAPSVVVHPLLLAEPATRAAELVRAEAEVTQIAAPVLSITLAQARAKRRPSTPGSFEQDLTQLANRWLKQEITNGTTTVGFVATGGDTALALCEALSAIAIWPEGEVLSGMPWSRMETASGEFPLVSKAGGFGDQEALAQAVAFLLNQSS